MANHSTQYSILFVCMGNICRSPAAEAVMTHLIESESLRSSFKVDSAGTIDFHVGNPPDSRMQHAVLVRGIEMTSKARQVQASDFSNFDLILGMDTENMRYLRELEADGSNRATTKPFCEFLRNSSDQYVPDPYYGGDEGFHRVLDLLEDGCQGVLEFALSEIKAQATTP